MNGRVALVAVVVVAVVVALGIYVVRSTSGGDDEGSPRPESSAAGSSSTTPEAEAGTASTSTVAPTTTLDETAARIDAELEALLVDEPPVSFAGAEPDDRSLDLAAAAAAEQDEAGERALLETRSFVRGRSRAWRTELASALVTVYRFETPEDAELYLTDGLITLSGFGAEAFAIPEVEGAQGFTQEGVEDGRAVSAAGITFTRGADWFLVVLAGDADQVSVESATALAVAQSATLAPPTG